MGNAGRFWQAFLVSFLAGFSTMIGGFTILLPFVKKTRYEIFAYVNACAGGVMIFIAISEILQIKAVESFEEALSAKNPGYGKYGTGMAYLFFYVGAAACFLLTLAMDKLVFEPELLKIPEEISNDEEDLESRQTRHKDRKAMCMMAINLLLALTVHNFPEGMVTFTEAYVDGDLKIPLAIAIAVHNIPEGMAIAIPIYYATGTVWKPLVAVGIASFAEPIGGLIGYAMIKNGVTPWFNAFSFSIISGVMVWIVIQELIPLSLKYSKSTVKVSMSFMLGSFIMALSLAGFKMI